MRRKKRVWSRAVIRELPQIGEAAVNRVMPAVARQTSSPGGAERA